MYSWSNWIFYIEKLWNMLEYLNNPKIINLQQYFINMLKKILLHDYKHELITSCISVGKNIIRYSFITEISTKLNTWLKTRVTIVIQYDYYDYTIKTEYINSYETYETYKNIFKATINNKNYKLICYKNDGKYLIKSEDLPILKELRHILNNICKNYREKNYIMKGIKRNSYQISGMELLHIYKGGSGKHHQEKYNLTTNSVTEMVSMFKRDLYDFFIAIEC